MKSQTTVRLLRRAFSTATALLLLTAGAHAQQFTTYDLVVPVSPTSTAQTVDGSGRILPTNRSYVIGIEGGVHRPIVLSNWNGTAEFPIIVVNKHGTGRVTVTDVVPGSTTYKRYSGIVVSNCNYLQLRGDNDPAHHYGIEVAQVGNKAGHSQVGVGLGGTSSNIEVMFLEVHDSGFAGIMAKTDPNCDNPEVWAANYVMENINIHDNYIHDVGGEGMYIGYTHWGEEETGCSPAPPVPIFGHEIHGIRISYNLIERSGWDGAQVASNPVDTKVHDNVIIHSGLAPTPGQGNGFQVGGGGTGEYFNNVIINSAYNSLVVIGQIGNVSVYNNLMVDSGDYGIFAKNLPEPPPSDPNAPYQTIPGTFVSFYNNTVINPANAAYYTIDEVSVNNWKNNISIVPNTSFTDVRAEQGAAVNTGGNVMQRDFTGMGFVNPAENDFRIAAPSNAANVGVSLAGLSAPNVPVTTDFQGLARPAGAAYDAGFNEAGPLSVYLIATPPTSGNTGSVKASAIGGTAPYTYAWSTSATTQTISSVPEGLYQVTVTDAVGATMTRATYLVNNADMGAPVRVTPPDEVIPPILSPAPGTYSGPQTITITTPTPGDTLRYTTDGSLPTASRGATYGGPITLAGTTTLKVIAYKSGMVNSTLTVGTYVITNGASKTKFIVPNANIAESAHTGSANTKDKTVDGLLDTQWQSSSLIRYFPSSVWTSATVAGAYNNDQHASAVTDSYFQAILVQGTQISWYGAKGPDGGIAAVTVDGGAETLVDTYSPTVVLNQLLFASAVLPETGHALKVRVTGTKNASSTGYRVVADRFVTSGTTYNDNQDQQWIRYDLGSNQRVGFLRMAFASGDKRSYRFQIQTSTDDINYTPLTDGRVDQEPTWFLSSRDTGLQEYDFPDIEPVRYVRIVGHGNNDGSKNLQPRNAYTEVEIWGGATGSALPRGLYEAEDAARSGAILKTNQTGYTGTGFVAYVNASGDYIEWTVTNPTASTRGLTFRYQSGGTPRSLAISVNGAVVEPTLAFHGTGAPGVWVDRAIAAALPAGTVTIRATTTGTNGPNIDSLRID